MAEFKILWPKKPSQIPTDRPWPAVGRAPLSVTRVEGVCTAKDGTKYAGKPLLITSKKGKSKLWVIIFPGITAGADKLTVTPYDTEGALSSEAVTLEPPQLMLSAVPTVEYPDPNTDPWDDQMAWGYSDECPTHCNVTTGTPPPIDNDGLTWDDSGTQIWCAFFALSTGTYTLDVANNTGHASPVGGLQVR
jgi:hypothetical protein